mgnify:FL=1|jgi:hypothetical protein|uniref:hypothetical protein n=1 Tax=Lachnospira eligens TaxID=39485 RepID=UPI002056C94D|nr:MAG TPA: protein of unknown function (UPF0137) [Caudoviricetes sp.]
MNEVLYTKTFNEWQQELDTELVKSAESFVKIGYLLKVARDTDILANTGYANVVEFAKARYGLDKTQVSRFIHINDRFSEGGNSAELQDRYKGMGYAKLTIMLQLPDEINEEISADFSKSEIEDIKKEIDEENKISDIEVWMEGTQEDAEKYNELGQVMYQLLHDMPELFTKIAQSSIETEELMNILAPSGEMIYSVRIPGTGRLMLSIKINTGRITITNVRSMEKTEWNIEDLADFVVDILSRADTEDPAKAWTSIYKEEYPKKAEIAPVQQEKPVQRKEKKVQKAKIEKPKPQSVEENTEEEQIPGQDSVLNHPEYLPENGNNKADSTENVQETDTFVDKQQEKPPYFEKVSAEKEKTEPEMPTNAINTECEDEVDALGNYMNCWEAICDAHRKITLFIEDYSAYDTTPDNMRIEAARINAVTLATELEHLKTL